MEAELRKYNIPLFAFESARPVGEEILESYMDIFVYKKVDSKLVSEKVEALMVQDEVLVERKKKQRKNGLVVEATDQMVL